MSAVYSSHCLSTGLECRFDPNSGKYHYVKTSSNNCGPVNPIWDSDPVLKTNPTKEFHETNSPLTSTTTVVPLQDMTNRTLERSSMIPVDESLYKKLSGLFPSVQEEELRQLCKRNYNNELAVMGDLSVRGFRPIYNPTRTTSYTTTIQGRHSTVPISNMTSTTLIDANSGVKSGPPNVSIQNVTTTTNSGITTTTTMIGNVNHVGMTDWSSTAPPQWMSAIRRTQSPIPTKVTHLIHTMSSTSTRSPPSGRGSPALIGKCYYPGRFVQGVGFEPSSMGGSPQPASKPFAPLQGRYALSGMITEKGSSSRTHYIQTVPRDPSYGQHGNRAQLPTTTSTTHSFPATSTSPGFLASHYSYSMSHTLPPPPPPPPPTSSRVYAPPIPSWYGEEDRIATTSSPQPASPRFYSVVHDALIKNRVMDRSASPVGFVTSSTRTYSPIFGGGVGPGRATPPERVPTPPYHPQSYSNTGGSFYATASRLYSQSPKTQGRTATISNCSESPPSSQPYPHYHVPPRSQVASTPPPPPPQHYQQQQLTQPQPTSQSQPVPPYRTYSPIQQSPFDRMAEIFPVRSSPGPHSPKIKLRYLRRIYPGVDETVLLDILSNADNNVQTAMGELNTMGYAKVDTPPVRPANAFHQRNCAAVPVAKTELTRILPNEDKDRPVAPPRRLTEADKQKTRARMLEKVKEVPATILTIALESVDFDEERALILLNNMKTDDKSLGYEVGTASVDADGKTKDGIATAEALQSKLSSLSKAPAVPIRKSQKDQSSGQNDVIMLSKSTWTQEDLTFRSRYKTETKGSDTKLRRGPNREILKNDIFMMCKGPNTNNYKGRNTELLLKSQPQNEEPHPIVALLGPQKENSAKGPIRELYKGHQSSLIQGSTYQFP